ncbi:MAG: hypothetical protein M3M98_02655 [Nitrospirota bacterium]|nr:hypothetical protein [Nitrospirota bacterium]
MTPVSTVREATYRFLTRELGTRRDPEELASAAVAIYEALLKILSPLLGNVGSQALFRRSLNLTKGTFPCYEEARTAKDDALLEAVSACLRQQQPDIAREASVALLIAFVELLATFIGERLTRQLLQEAWPEILTVTSEETHS